MFQWMFLTSFLVSQNSFCLKEANDMFGIGMCSQERVDKRFLQYVDTSNTSVHALNVHMVFFFSLAIHKFGRHGLKLCILECFGSLN